MVLFVLSILAGVFYYAGIKYLESSYATSYSQLPFVLKVSSGDALTVLSNLHGISSSPSNQLSSNLAAYANPLELFILILSALIIVLGFGFFTLIKPEVSALLLSPWLFVVLTWSNSLYFIYPGFEYYSFTIGATIVASIIGLNQMNFGPKNNKLSLNRVIVAFSVIVIVLMLAFVSLVFAARPLEFLTNYSNPTPSSTYNSSQIYPLIKLIPQNVSVMTEGPISPHVSGRAELEYTYSNKNYGSYFVPDYILVSYNSTTNPYTNVTFDDFVRSINNYAYELVSRDGNARLYRKT